MAFSNKDEGSRYLKRAREVLDTEIDGIRAVRESLGDPFLSLVDLCLQSLERGGKLVLSGIGKSGHIGHKMAATLASTGSAAVFMHPVEAMHGDLGMLATRDLLIALSYSGETDEVLSVLPAAKRLGVPIVAITGDSESRLAEWVDCTVPMTVPREACPFNLAPTTTTTALVALGDALAIVLLEARGFRSTDYAKLHPAGAIGRSITLHVTDIMRTGKAFPTVNPETPIRDALVLMTGAHCGSVAIVDQAGHLLGIFTDGDFRRGITTNPGLLDEKIQTAMTPDPVSIGADSMAIELLNLLEKRRVDDVLVVDAQNRVLGLVDTQDLPKFKLM